MSRSGYEVAAGPPRGGRLPRTPYLRGVPKKDDNIFQLIFLITQ